MKGAVLYCFVNSCAHKVIHSYGHLDFLGRELAHDVGGFVALLDVVQLVAVLGDGRLHFAAVRSLLLKLLAQFEGDDCVLECRRGLEGVRVAVLGQLNDGAHGVAHLAGHHAHPKCLHHFIEILALVELVFAAEKIFHRHDA